MLYVTTLTGNFFSLSSTLTGYSRKTDFWGAQASSTDPSPLPGQNVQCTAFKILLVV